MTIALSCMLIARSRGGFLAGYQMALDTAKTAKSLLSQNNFAIGYCKDDLTLHTAVSVSLPLLTDYRCILLCQ